MSCRGATIPCIDCYIGKIVDVRYLTGDDYRTREGYRLDKVSDGWLTLVHPKSGNVALINLTYVLTIDIK